jgi:hypothetical protein
MAELLGRDNSLTEFNHFATIMNFAKAQQSY